LIPRKVSNGDAIDDLAFHFAVLDERGCDPGDPF
jgi:hypothetical protein